MTDYCGRLKIYIWGSPLSIATWSIISFQDSASPSIEQLIFFHDSTIAILTLITVLVGLNIAFITSSKITNRFLLQEQTTEIIWTCVPVLILFSIAGPSIHVLYLLDDPFSPNLTIKAIGHQWYWSYEYSDFPQIEFDSYILPTSDLETGRRLIEVDNSLVVPAQTKIRVIATGADVIHSWTVPTLGVKADAVPGRLNQIIFSTNRTGVFYGQCREICGANHRFIPIKIESVPVSSFIKWTMSFSSVSGWKSTRFLIL